MQPLIIAEIGFKVFHLPFITPFTFAGNTLNERKGYYLTVKTSTGLMAHGEIAPLPGVSPETDRRVKHDLEEACHFFKNIELKADADELIKQMRNEFFLHNYCASVRFGIESAFISLLATIKGVSLVELLNGQLRDVPTAALLQGAHAQVMADAKHLKAKGYHTFKLKVGDRNIALDIKKVHDLRFILEKDDLLRLDGNRVWSLKEANIFAELAGLELIEFIEEPLSDASRINEFYQAYHMPVALDETLAVVQPGITAPGRCMPTLANSEAVKAYVLKPSMLGGIITTLDWIQEARSNGKKAIISSSFESPVGLKVLANLACLTGETAGLGTERWFKGVTPLVNEFGIIPAASLK